MLHYPRHVNRAMWVLKQITVDEDRTVKSLYQFLKKNAAIPFTVVKASKAEEATTASKSDTSKLAGTTPKSSHEAKDEL